MVDETQPAIENHDSRKRPGWRVGVLAATVLLTTALILTASFAAFSDTTDNSGNTWSAGTVVLTDDDGGVSAMFTVSDMAPLATVTKCILVTYSGSLVPADVNLYGVSGGTGLDAFLNVIVEEGSGGTFATCAGFTAIGPAIFTGTLAGFAGTHTNFTNGVGAWNPAVNPESRTYRFTVTLQDANGAQGLDATATFTWEAQA
ncbi:MAG: hypothetical protein IH943_12850 [Acidobacteria bacterium]|nr:hypothetical protein [Acidobacteriota bacterium]